MKMAKKDVNINCGGGICMTLFIVFLVLKLTNTIAWSWWWVTAPLWGPAALVILFLLGVGLVAVAATLLTGGK